MAVEVESIAQEGLQEQTGLRKSVCKRKGLVGYLQSLSKMSELIECVQEQTQLDKGVGRSQWT